MLAYRIAKSKYIADLAGTGPRLVGSRWTQKGVQVLFVSENRALAALELWGHVRTASLPPLKCATIEIPDGAGISMINLPDLPADWRNSPAPTSLQLIGSKWLAEGTFILKVPSVQVPLEYNFILNVEHPDMAKVKVVAVTDFCYDERICLLNGSERLQLDHNGRYVRRSSSRDLSVHVEVEEISNTRREKPQKRGSS